MYICEAFAITTTTDDMIINIISNFSILAKVQVLEAY